MKETDTVAAILTVAFYTARGGAMSLPHILATYNVIRGLLAAQSAPRKKKRLGRPTTKSSPSSPLPLLFLVGQTLLSALLAVR